MIKGGLLIIFYEYKFSKHTVDLKLTNKTLSLICIKHHDARNHNR